MMVQIACLVIICTLGTVIAGTSNYPFVKFVNGNQRPASSQQKLTRYPKNVNGRPTRSFHFPEEYFAFADDEVWPESIFIHNPDTNLFDFTLGYSGHTHFSPDYSNGLSYPDPYLLRGNDARRAVAYIYGKGELFFNNIPHNRAILKLQQQRAQNGLAPNRLGSLNNRSPFFRL